jgi:transcriptional regulator with XRE-family HTH domain
MTDVLSARRPVAGFAALLRRLRAEARLTQEELAEAAGLSPRSISDLERGVSRTARKETARLLADALAIGGPARTAFVAAARGKAPTSEVLTAREGPPTGPLPCAILWSHCEDPGLDAHGTKLGQSIAAMAAAGDAGGSVACIIWLVGLATVITSETTPSRTRVLTAHAAGTGNVVQPNKQESEGRRRPIADQALPPLGHAIQLALSEAVAAALNYTTAAP